jgi:arabinogalactan oligomer/maltooligosaccharide transport system permease protein
MRNKRSTTHALTLTLLGLAVAGCGQRDQRRVVTIWHQMRPVESRLIDQQIGRFEAAHPGIRVRSLYKETEESRSGFQSAALAGGGPELVYGPSDVMGPYHTMGLLQDMTPWFPRQLQRQFAEAALAYLPATDDPRRLELLQVGDRIGNHLSLVYNRDFVGTPPTTTDELVRIAVQNTWTRTATGEWIVTVWSGTSPNRSL